MTFAASPEREAVMSRVRAMIADGTLKPGAAAPSAERLARETGAGRFACRAALRALAGAGDLEPGPSPGARMRVPCGREAQDAGAAARARLAASLRTRRKDAGMTQEDLAGRLGVSVTTVGHAETGRMWHSRGFWLRAGILLGDGGDLLRQYDALTYPVPQPPPAVLPLSIGVTAGGVLVTWPDGTENLVPPPP